jgi:hypothetical protein
VEGERSPPTRIPSDGKHPGSLERVALRGATQERVPWLVHEDDGNIQPVARRASDSKGCSRSSCEEGHLHPPSFCGSRRREEGPSLRATRPAQSSAVFQRPSPQTVVGSRRRPQAASRSEGSFRGLVLRRACSAVELASEGLSRLAALVVALRKGSRHDALKSIVRSRAHSTSPQNAGRTKRRESDARECVRAS